MYTGLWRLVVWIFSTRYWGWWSSHSHLTIILLRWGETTHQPDLLSYHSIQPVPWMFRQESWWWVMSDESWIWVRCTGGCVCKCDRRPGYFGWQRQPVDPWQIHGRLWWLWASGQWCFGTLNEPMIAMVQWSMIYTYKYKATARAWSPDQGYRALSVLLQESICQKLPGI